MAAPPSTPPIRDDPSNRPSDRPRPVSAGDDVDVGVPHRLPGRRPVVEADGEPIGPQLVDQHGSHPGDQFPHRRLLGERQVEQAGNVSRRDDERVALGHREAVGDGDRRSTRQSDASRLQAAEGAVGRGQERTRFVSWRRGVRLPRTPGQAG